MIPKLSIALMAAAAAVLVATGLFAENTLVPGASSGKEFVSVRKYVMITNNANLRDIRLKLKAKKSDEVVCNGRSLAAGAMILPFLFAEPYADVYPVPGSTYAYKAVPLAEVQAAAELLNAQSQKLVNLAGKDAETTKQLDRIKDACRDCHAKMRTETK